MISRKPTIVAAMLLVEEASGSAQCLQSLEGGRGPALNRRLFTRTFERERTVGAVRCRRQRLAGLTLELSCDNEGSQYSAGTGSLDEDICCPTSCFQGSNASSLLIGWPSATRWRQSASQASGSTPFSFAVSISV